MPFKLIILYFVDHEFLRLGLVFSERESNSDGNLTFTKMAFLVI